MFGGASAATSGQYADTWEWDGNDWRLRSPAVAPAGRRGYAATWDSARQRTLLFGGADYAALRTYFNDTWEYATSAPASATAFGSGCVGSAGTPSLQASSPPWLGQPATLVVSSTPPSAPVLVAFSLSNTAWGTTPLPMPLAAFGMPGCSLLVGAGTLGAAASTGPSASIVVAVPPNPALAGAVIHTQALIVDPLANTAGATTSNGLTLQLGAL
jgi:hypothetical protein